VTNTYRYVRTCRQKFVHVSVEHSASRSKSYEASIHSYYFIPQDGSSTFLRKVGQLLTIRRHTPEDSCLESETG
jgi:hypothetical protein